MSKESQRAKWEQDLEFSIQASLGSDQGRLSSGTFKAMWEEKGGTHLSFTVAFSSQHHITLTFRKSSCSAVCEMSLSSSQILPSSCSLAASTNVFPSTEALLHPCCSAQELLYFAAGGPGLTACFKPDAPRL